jgi:hypothetical protein
MVAYCPDEKLRKIHLLNEFFSQVNFMLRGVRPRIIKHAQEHLKYTKITQNLTQSNNLNQ